MAADHEPAVRAAGASSRSRRARSAAARSRRSPSGSVASTWPRVGRDARRELGQERRGEPVACDDDRVGVDARPPSTGSSLADVGARRRGVRREPAHPARRVERTVARDAGSRRGRAGRAARRARRPTRPRSRPRAARRARAGAPRARPRPRASRRLPTRRNASPASASMRSSDRSVSSITSRARSWPSARRASS